MTTPDATVAPAATTPAARRYEHQLHVLVDHDTRALIIGLAALAAAEGGYNLPKQGEQVRELLDDAIAQLARKEPTRYLEALRAGHAELGKREAASA